MRDIVANTGIRGRYPSRIRRGKRLSGDGMRVVAITDPSAPPTMQRGAQLAIDTLNGWHLVGLDQWLIGPSEVMVLATGPLAPPTPKK